MRDANNNSDNSKQLDMSSVCLLLLFSGPVSGFPLLCTSCFVVVMSFDYLSCPCCFLLFPLPCVYLVSLSPSCASSSCLVSFCAAIFQFEIIDKYFWPLVNPSVLGSSPAFLLHLLFACVFPSLLQHFVVCSWRLSYWLCFTTFFLNQWRCI